MYFNQYFWLFFVVAVVLFGKYQIQVHRLNYFINCLICITASLDSFTDIDKPLVCCPFSRSDAIYSAFYDGTNMIEIIRGHEYLSHPFAVSLYGSEVYWTDWRTNTLAKANKWTGQNVSVIQKTSAQPFDLQIYHPSRQPQGRCLGQARHLETLSHELYECKRKDVS